MAVKGTLESIEETLALQEEIIEEKKLATGDINWKPINYSEEDGGAGYIPEQTWIELYSPSSVERTAV